MSKKKVVVLGGGVGSMTAAYYLAPHYDVSVYQVGWRLGGKGASGRNPMPGYGERIEEHGLHIWFGFYQNAFRLMREVYGKLNRPPTNPLATWTDAFKQHDVITIMEDVGTPPHWAAPWIIDFPTNGGTPGEADAQPKRIEHLIKLIEWTGTVVENYLAGSINVNDPDAIRKTAFAKDVQAHINAIANRLVNTPAEGPIGDIILDFARMVQAMLQVVTRYMLPMLESDDDFRHLVYLVDIAMAVLTAFIRADLLRVPWDSIDHIEFHDFLSQNGITPFTRFSSPIRAIYDLAFGYRDGVADEAHADMAAGSTLRGLMWMAFGYAGSIMYKMQAGMGDTVFSPIYELLVRDFNVPFYFFQRVLDVVPSDDGTRIEKIIIGIQAHPFGGPANYKPLVDVKDLGCWPSLPLFGQLEEGETLRPHDLESPQSPWLETKELVAGVDFDHVIFGVSIGSVPALCPKLIAQKPAWKEMVDHVLTVRTQAFQMWLNKNIKELGWQPAITGADKGQLAVVGTFVEPMDTWADMSQLIVREAWPPEANVQNIAYFCGPLEVNDDPLASVYNLAKSYVENDIQTLWTNTGGTPGAFPWDWLVDPKNGSGIDRFKRQYFRANHAGSELYVLSVRDSTKYRLRARETGYENMSIAGDWNRNTLSLGCVESACMGGLEAVRGLVPGLHIVDEEGAVEIGKD